MLHGIDFCLLHVAKQVQGPEINTSHEKYFLVRPASMVLTLLFLRIDNMFWFKPMTCFMNHWTSFFRIRREIKFKMFNLLEIQCSDYNVSIRYLWQNIMIVNILINVWNDRTVFLALFVLLTLTIIDIRLRETDFRIFHVHV